MNELAGEERLPRPVPKRYVGAYDRGRCGEPPPADLLRGIAEFNAGRYWEQHETLERIWRLERDDVRYLYQGILLVGVGLHHLRRGNAHGAIRKLEHGLSLLERFEPTCQRIDVVGLVADTRRCRDAVRQSAPDRLADVPDRLYPRVRLLAAPTGEARHADC